MFWREPVLLEVAVVALFHLKAGGNHTRARLKPFTSPTALGPKVHFEARSRRLADGFLAEPDEILHVSPSLGRIAGLKSRADGLL